VEEVRAEKESKMVYQGTNKAKKEVCPACGSKHVGACQVIGHTYPLQKNIVTATARIATAEEVVADIKQAIKATKKPDPVKPDDLPLVSVVSSRETMDALIDIMVVNNTLAEEMYWMTQAVEANKKKAVALLLEEGLAGVRHGSLYVRIGEEETKKTLDLGLIALHFGLDLDEVKAHCYKESKPFRKTWVDDMAKPKRQKAAESSEE
jgi:hypothetical protein